MQTLIFVGGFVCIGISLLIQARLRRRLGLGEFESLTTRPRAVYETPNAWSAVFLVGGIILLIWGFNQ